MIRRTTAVYHVLMVSILLLAHAVIPHIHFDSEIVITGSGEHQKKENCEHNHHKHSEKGDDEANFCLLKQVYLARSNDTDSENDIAALLKHFKDFQGFHCAIFNSADYFIFIPETKISYSVFCSPLHSFLCCGNINTRGSPFV